MASPLLIGIDLGTTFCKAVVLDVDGVERGQGRMRTPWSIVPTGAEAAPAALVEAALAATRDALASTTGPVAGVGVTGMAETGVLLGAGGEPVVRAIAWHDTRGEAEAEALLQAFGAERFAATTGLRPSALCTLAKYRWLRDNVAAAARGVRWLGVPEFVVRCLGGADAAELSLASRTGMLDVVDARWWPEALDWAGGPEGLLPEPVPAGTPVGRVGAALPGARGATLTVAGHDHLVAAIGAGARDGDVLDDCGTAEALVRAVAPMGRAQIQAAVGAGLTVGWHAIPDRHALLSGFGLSAPLARVLRMLGIATPQARERLDREAADLPPDEGGVRVEGLHEAEMAIVGLRHDVSPARVWRAALEAAGEASADALGRIERFAGPSRRIVMVGGETRSPAMRAVRSARFGALHWSAVSDAPARGAALLAGRAAGVLVAL